MGLTEEQAIITILHLTGMHVSSLCSFGPGSMIRQGSRTYPIWVRPKTNKTARP